MALFSINNVKLSGVAACVPKNEESNYDYEWITPKERELLIKTTGIEKRRVADRKFTTADMCLEAARKLINELKWKKEEIELLIFVSQSRDYTLPATGIILQNKLGLPKTTIAFDISLGCSGYVYGLSVAAGFLTSGAIKKGILLTGDVSSFSLSYKDKSTYPLFGDAGTATALEFKDGVPPIDFNLQSDGSGYEAIIIPHGEVRNPSSHESQVEVEIEKGIIRSKLNLALNGMEVFNFSMREVAPSIKKLYEYNDSSNDSYDYFVFHQANLLMNETIRKKLKIEVEKVPYSLRNYGNTSSASIPLTIVTELAEKVKNKPASLLLSGFGVGLSWGVASVKIENLVCPELIEL